MPCCILCPKVSYNYLMYTDLYLLNFQGDNQYRTSGQASEFKQLTMHAWEAFEKGQDMHMQSAPSQAEFMYKFFMISKDKLKTKTRYHHGEVQ